MIFCLPRSPVGASLSNRRTVAMVVNDNACGLVKRGALGSIASRLAPTGLRTCVGASLSNRRTVAMVVNDNAGGLVKRGALGSIASRLAPTGLRS